MSSILIPWRILLFGLAGSVVFEIILFFFYKDKKKKRDINVPIPHNTTQTFKNHCRMWLHIYAISLSALYTITFIVYCFMGEGRFLTGQVTMLWIALLITLLIAILSNEVPLAGIILFFMLGWGLLIAYFLRRINYIALVERCVVPYYCDDKIFYFEVGLRYMISLSIVILLMGLVLGSSLLIYGRKLNRTNETVNE